ncbi:MAG: aminotransferase class V-fold PLP-dependent enzyme [Planctomycetota bacterium]|nr:aminotransferase class V-fold PLP-dependent enzyme [Planctomycetota bacterium]
MQELLDDAARRAIRYLRDLPERRVFPDDEALAGLEGFEGDLPAEPSDPAEVLEKLDRLGSPATVATCGPRYFGFVIGGVLPAPMAASWLAGAWDQNAGMVTGSPVAARLEEIAERWLVELLALTPGTGAAFTTGATAANLCGIVAARHALLARAGWDVEAEGLFGAPPLRVVVGDEVHLSVLKALGIAGLGRARIERVPADGQGSLIASELPQLDARTIVCCQAGNVNTGAFDPIAEVVERAREVGAWVHVDGAFGLWARASRGLASLAPGLEHADSLATDGHKWLNVPYDSGIAFVRERQHLVGAMAGQAAYLIETERREPWHTTPEMSRRGRGIEVWAALASLGRAGLEDLFDRCCRHAQRFAEGARDLGVQVLNEVVLNQVLLDFGGDEATARAIEALQREGTLWAGGTSWQGRAPMRVSFSSWATSDADVERSLDALRRIVV